MCGIFGIHCGGGRGVDLAALVRSTTALRHRGPDDEGYLLVNTRTAHTALCGGRDTTPELNLPSVEGFDGGPFNLAFGFRRLSILDPSPAGHQPMASADGQCWIVFNGEIYNYLELREELSRYGHEFRTGTDTEVILAAYRQWGADCVTRFNGMWALAIWDGENRRLFLSRDRFGIKPLYYFEDDRRFIFASEIKALLQCDEVKRRANPRRLYEYLRFGLTDHDAETLFEGIRQLPLAHSLIVPFDDRRAAHPVRYWRIDLDRKADLSFEESTVRLRELFRESVRLHLRSDVPVGAALSGGIDSSSIVMAMRSIEPHLELHTFSYLADDPAVSEERWVDVVSAAAQSRVHKVKPAAEDLLDDLDHLIYSQDEPFGSTSMYAQYRVFRLTHQAGIKVMLDGQGADEMLAGYRFFLSARLASLFRHRSYVEAYKFLNRASKLPGARRSALLIGTAGLLLPAGGMLASGLHRIARLRRRGHRSSPGWLNAPWFEERGVTPPTPPPPNGRDVLQGQLHKSLLESSLPGLLRYEDRNSMAFSIESRVPFLTADLAEFILSLPEKYIVSEDGTSKSVFRQAMRGIVPDVILDRRDKIGFATPEHLWLTTLRPWVEEVLGSDTARRVPGLNLPAVKQEWEAIVAGRSSFDWRVWRWLNLIRWSQNFEVSF